jgi:chemotaxis protein histidine kinase CheA
MSTSGGEPDLVMLELFKAEADMHLPVLSNGLLALEKGSADRKQIESMMRAAHSVKGAARIVGIEAAVRVAHALEDCFTAAKEDRLTLSSDIVDVLLDGVDVLQRICVPEQGATIDEGVIQPILDRIAQVRDGKTAVKATPAPAPPAAITVAAAEDRVVLPANLDASAAEAVRRQLGEILGQKPGHIRIDFGQVERVAAVALSLLLAFARDAKATLPAPVVEAHRVAPPLRALFRVTGLEYAFVVQN